MKTSINYNSIAWLSQFGTGDISFVPLVQSSSFELNTPKVTHKGIGSKKLISYYNYKNDNISFSMNVLASMERTFGTQLTRTNFATENYVSGEIVDYSLSGCRSALYDLSTPNISAELSFYNLIDEYGDYDLAGTGYYSGFFTKFENCLIDNLSISAEVGGIVNCDTSFLAQDVLFSRTGISYISGINDYYEAIRPQDVIIFVGSGDNAPTHLSGFNATNIQIELPIQYKQIECFGSNLPSARKIVLPAVGSVKIGGLPVLFREYMSGYLQQEESHINMTILMRAKQLKSTGISDYVAIKFPKLYVESQSLRVSVGERLNGDIAFSFFEYGCEYTSGEEGMFFLRKMPETINYFAV